MFFDLKRHSLVEVMTCLNTCTIRSHRFFFLFFNFMFDLEKIKKLRWWEFQANHVSTGQEENHNYYNPMPHLEIIMIMTLIIIWFVTDVSRWPLQPSPLWTCVWFLTGRWAPIRQAGKVMRSDGTSSQCDGVDALNVRWHHRNAEDRRVIHLFSAGLRNTLQACCVLEGCVEHIQVGLLYRKGSKRSEGRISLI